VIPISQELAPCKRWAFLIPPFCARPEDQRLGSRAFHCIRTNRAEKRQTVPKRYGVVNEGLHRSGGGVIASLSHPPASLWSLPAQDGRSCSSRHGGTVPGHRHL